MGMAAFSFLKVLVQTRARAHTAIGTVCYRFGLSATSTLETPVRQWPTAEETRAFDAAEMRRVAAAKAAGEKTQRRRLRPKLLRMDPPRHYDFRGRVGIEVSGCALPEGASEAWRAPLEWARRVEAADGHRVDSRQCRDDVMGIPLELVRSGFADLAMARQAAKVAELRKTPVHWVIHRPHGGGLNWHAHLVYAGRRLTEDGEAFASKRDTAQDKPELVEAHKALWVETCREFGVEISFEFRGKAIEGEVRREFVAEHGLELSEENERAIQIETRRRWKEHRQARSPGHDLTPKAVRAERAAVANEEGARLDAIIQGAGGAPLSEQDRLELGRIASAVDELDTRELLALERIPVTTAGRLAKYGPAPEAPAPVPAHRVEPPRPTAASVREAPLVPAMALLQPEAVAGAVAGRPAPLPIGEARLVPTIAIPGPMPVPSHPAAAPRPGPAPVVEALLFPPRGLSEPQPLSTSRLAPPRPAPAVPVPLAASNTLERMLPAPVSLHRVEPPRPMAAPVVAAPVVSVTALARPAPMPVAVAASPTPSPRAETPAVLIRSIAESKPVPLQPVTALRPNPAPTRLHRVEPPRPEAARIVHVGFSSSLRRRAGLEEQLPFVLERPLRPPRPVSQVEEALAPSVEQQRPAAAPEVIHPPPEPPWRRRVRRALRIVRDWWPWALKPPSPDRRIRVRLPEQARPVPDARPRLAAPREFSRPRPESKPILRQTPDGYDFDPVAKTVTINAKRRAIEAEVRAELRAALAPLPPLPRPATAPEPRPSQEKSKGKGRDDGGIGF